jgi:hypothetical protein
MNAGERTYSYLAQLANTQQGPLLVAQCSPLATKQFGKHSQHLEKFLNEIRPTFRPIHTKEPRGIIKGVNVLFFSV